MLSVPNVATNGGKRNRVIISPLNQPIARPVTTPATIAPNTVNCSITFHDEIVMPFFSRPAAIAPESASTEPTDRSMPPEITIIVMPIERHRLMEICRNTFRPLSTVRKESVDRLSATTIALSAK